MLREHIGRPRLICQQSGDGCSVRRFYCTGQYAITNDAIVLCEAHGVEAIIEATGEVEFGAHVAMKAIENRKHIILMNAELDATLGPLLKYMRTVPELSSPMPMVTSRGS